MRAMFSAALAAVAVSTLAIVNSANAQNCTMGGISRPCNDPWWKGMRGIDNIPPCAGKPRGYKVVIRNTAGGTNTFTCGGRR
jgi:hypothetical protein